MRVPNEVFMISTLSQARLVSCTATVIALNLLLSLPLGADGPTFVGSNARTVRTDLSTTYPFADDPLLIQSTPIRRVHVTELRDAVNSVRQQAGLAAFSWTDPQPTSIRALHVTELRAALTEAFAALSRPAPIWTESVAPGGRITARHFQEIRDAARWEAAGTITTNTTWSASGSPYVVQGDVAVTSGATLTIAPGTVVKFSSGTNLHIFEGATLIANGTPSQPIVFTSVKDDSVAGDTNRDGNATAPARGDWGTISVGNPVSQNAPAAYGSVTNAIIRYGTQFLVRFSAPTLRNVTSTQMNGDGLYLEAPPPVGYTIERLTLTDNERHVTLVRVPGSVTLRDSILRRASFAAVLAGDNTSASLVNNAIEDNRGSVAIQATNSPIVLRYNSIARNHPPDGVARGVHSTGATVDARHNWWGSTTGPTVVGQSLTGGGGQVGAETLYDDWLGKPWAEAFRSGAHPWTLKAGVGVDVATGNFFLVENDLAIKTVGFPLEIRRTYNNKIAGSVSSEFGVGWSWNYGTRLETNVDAHGVIWRREDGVGTYFKRNADDTFSSEDGVYEKLVWSAASSIYRITHKNQAYLEFSSTGQLLAQVDASGNRTTVARDGSGRVTTITEPKGRTLTVEYEGQYIWKITDPLGRTLTYQRNPNGAVASVVKRDQLGSTFGIANYYYGARGPWEMIGFRDADGNGLEQEFDFPQQRVVSQRFNSNNEVRFVYGPAISDGIDVPEYATLVWDSRRRAHKYSFTPTTKIVEHDRQHVTSTGWTWVLEDAWSYASYLTSSYTNPDGTTISTYDWSSGNVTQVVEPGGRTTTYTYDAFNNRTSETDHLSRTTRYEYDAYQRLVKTTDPLGNVSTNSYYADGLLMHASDARHRATFFTYDAHGYPQSVSNPENEITRFTYDVVGRKTADENPLGQRTVYSYDGRDNVLDVTNPLGERITFTYDGFGRKTRTTDAMNRATSYEYNDATNALWKTTDARGGVVELTRDAFAGNITEVKDANQHVTKFAYDDLNRRSSETDALGRTHAYEYVGRDRILRRTDAMGNVTRFDYDSANRIRQVTYADGQSARFEYDSVGNRIQLHDWTGSTVWDYDGLNRVVHVGKGSKSTKYTYDAVGNLTELSYEAGKTVGYNYDEADRLRAVIDWNSKVTTYTYDDAGRVIVCAYPNGVDGRWTYDNAGRPTAIKYSRAGSTLAAAEYQYDAAGNRTSRRHGDGGLESYAYDELYRLTGVTYPDGRYETFSYDATGNRLSRFDSRNGFTLYYAYDAADQMLNDDFGQRWFNGNGALTSDSRPRTFVWNSQELLAAVQDPWTYTSYRYDGEGRRVQITTYGRTTDQVVDAVEDISRVLSETTAGVTRYFVYGNALVSAVEGTSSLYHHPDALGSTILVTRADGTVDGSFSHDAFGRLRTGNFYTWTSRQFAGEEQESTEFIYLRARYYDPLSGRFLSQDTFPSDPSDTQALNRYTYVKNNATNYVDPSGEIAVVAIPALAGIVLGLLNQLVTDIAAGRWSTPIDYGAAAAGGVVASYVALRAPLAAGPAGAIVTNRLQQEARIRKGEQQSVNRGELAQQGVFGLIGGRIPGSQIPGVTVGPNSFLAIERQMITKATRGQIFNVSGGTAGKMLTGRVVRDFRQTFIGGTIFGYLQGASSTPPRCPW